ncbi:MAG: phage tail tape measure protein [Rhodospirillaceae bacterium]
MATLQLIIDAQGAKAGAAQFDQATKRVHSSANQARDSVARFGAGVRGSSSAVAGLRQHILGLVGPLAAFHAFRTQARSLAEYESSLVGVQKTTDLTGESLRVFSDDVLRLSTQIPVAASRLNEFAEAAGQLGVNGSDNLLAFAETIARLDFATVDLRGTEAASTLARILKLTGEGAGEVRTLANVIVALGNNMAATEGQIATIAEELAAATVGFGFSSAELATLAAAFKTTGGEAEASRTAVSRTLIEMRKAVLGANDSLEAFARLAGVTEDEFSKAFRSDAFGTFVAVMEGLGREGERATLVLDELGLSGVRVGTRLQPLAQEFKILADAIEITSDELASNDALVRESEKAFATLSGALASLKNTYSAALQEQDGLTGSMTTLLVTVNDAVKVFRGMAVEEENVSSVSLLLANAFRVLTPLSAAMAGEFGVVSRATLRMTQELDAAKRAARSLGDVQAEVAKARRAGSLREQIDAQRAYVAALSEQLNVEESLSESTRARVRAQFEALEPVLAAATPDRAAFLRELVDQAQAELVRLEQAFQDFESGQSVVSASNALLLFEERMRVAIGSVGFTPRMQEAEQAVQDFRERLEGFTDEDAARVRELFKELEDEERLQQFSDDLGRAIAGPIEDGILRAREFGDVLRSIAQQIAAVLIRQTITEPLAGGLGDFFGGLFESAHGNVFSRGNVVPFATGGVISSPVAFPLVGGVGIAGERGPEAILPLQRNSAGDLGVAVADASGSPDVVAELRMLRRDLRSLRGGSSGGYTRAQVERRGN